MVERFLEDYTVGQKFVTGHVRVETSDVKTFALEFYP